MPFQPQVREELEIDGTTYRVAEHPNAPGMPFGQEGRQAVVYQLAADDERRALKAFKPRFSTPSLVLLADQIARLASLPGLQVCQRTVLTARRHTALLRRFPDLTYAVLMPWVEGPTWQEIVLEKKTLTLEESLKIAHALAEVLVTMEERGIAHCDLSGPNLILSPDLSQAAVALVDVEGIYAPGLSRPDVLPAGSPGYAHRTAPQGLWSRQADRFAGAVMLAEILGWGDSRVREAAWGENYFHAQEMQKESERYAVLVQVLRSTWGDDLANLLTAAWHSDTLADCPTLGKWLVALPERAPARLAEPPPSAAAESLVNVTLLVLNAQSAADAGSWDQALTLYRQALQASPPELAADIMARIAAVEARQASSAAPRPESAAAPPPKPQEAVVPWWDCPHCGRAVGEEMAVCPHCERGRQDGTVMVETRAEPPPGWRCPNCGRYAPGEMEVCPHCERGRRDGTIIRAPVRVPAEPEVLPETGPTILAQRVPPSFIARWAPVLLLGVGWALAWYIGRDTAGDVLSWWYQTQGPVAWNARQTIVSALAGALAGLVTGLALTWTEGSIRIRQVLLLALGWAVGSAGSSWISATYLPASLREISLGGSLVAAAGGIIGGLTTGLVLRRSGSLLRWGQLIWVILGYAAAWFLASLGSSGLFRTLMARSGALASIGQAIAFGGVAGVVGTSGLYWQLGRLTGRAVSVAASAERRPPSSIRRFAGATAMGWGGAWVVGHVVGGLLFVLVVERMISFSLMAVVSGLVIGAVLGAATGWVLGRLGYPLSGRGWLILTAVWAVAGGAAMILVSSPAGAALADAVGWRRVSYVFVRKYGHMGPRGFRMAGWFLGWFLAALAAGVTVGRVRRSSGRPMPWRRTSTLAAGFGLSWVIALFAAELVIEHLLMPIERSVRTGIPLADLVIDLFTGGLAGAAAGIVLHRLMTPGRPDQQGPSA